MDKTSAKEEGTERRKVVSPFLKNVNDESAAKVGTSRTPATPGEGSRTSPPSLSPLPPSLSPFAGSGHPFAGSSFGDGAFGGSFSVSVGGPGRDDGASRLEDEGGSGRESERTNAATVSSDGRVVYACQVTPGADRRLRETWTTLHKHAAGRVKPHLLPLDLEVARGEEDDLPEWTKMALENKGIYGWWKTAAASPCPGPITFSQPQQTYLAARTHACERETRTLHPLEAHNADVRDRDSRRNLLSVLLAEQGVTHANHFNLICGNDNNSGNGEIGADVSGLFAPNAISELTNGSVFAHNLGGSGAGQKQAILTGVPRFGVDGSFEFGDLEKPILLLVSLFRLAAVDNGANVELVVYSANLRHVIARSRLAWHIFGFKATKLDHTSRFNHWSVFAPSKAGESGERGAKEGTNAVGSGLGWGHNPWRSQLWIPGTLGDEGLGPGVLSTGWPLQSRRDGVLYSLARWWKDWRKAVDREGLPAACSSAIETFTSGPPPQTGGPPPETGGPPPESGGSPRETGGPPPVSAFNVASFPNEKEKEKEGSEGGEGGAERSLSTSRRSTLGGSVRSSNESWDEEARDAGGQLINATFPFGKVANPASTKSGSEGLWSRLPVWWRVAKDCKDFLLGLSGSRDSEALFVPSDVRMDEPSQRKLADVLGAVRLVEKEILRKNQGYQSPLLLTLSDCVSALLPWLRDEIVPPEWKAGLRRVKKSASISLPPDPTTNCRDDSLAAESGLLGLDLSSLRETDPARLARDPSVLFALGEAPRCSVADILDPLQRQTIDRYRDLKWAAAERQKRALKRGGHGGGTGGVGGDAEASGPGSDEASDSEGSLGDDLSIERDLPWWQRSAATERDRGDLRTHMAELVAEERRISEMRNRENEFQIEDPRTIVKGLNLSTMERVPFKPPAISYRHIDQPYCLREDLFAAGMFGTRAEDLRLLGGKHALPSGAPGGGPGQPAAEPQPIGGRAGERGRGDLFRNSQSLDKFLNEPPSQSFAFPAYKQK